MGFNVFKQKEVINNDSDEKNKNDIIDDYGKYIKNNNTINSDMTLSSFEKNFEENIKEHFENDKKIEETNTNSVTNDSLPDNNLNLEFFSNITDESNDNNLMNYQNVDNNYTNFNNPINQDLVDAPNSYIKPEINDINNYNYNPIMDNIENVSDNLKNSEDVNVALSNLYKKEKKRRKTR